MIWQSSLPRMLRPHRWRWPESRHAGGIAAYHLHMKPPTFHVHQARDPQGLASELAAFVADRLKEALRERGHALLIVSGGSTPVPFLQALAEWPLDWAQVHVTLADERCVPAHDEHSNVRLVREHLLRSRASSVCLHSLMSDPPDVAQTEAMLDRLPWPADVVVLGMGSDGHTASLFPHAPELEQALDPQCLHRCMAVAAPQPPNVPVPRITLTARALLDSRDIVVHTTGRTKRALLERACEPGELQQWPIRLVLLQEEVPCHLFHVD